MSNTSKQPLPQEVREAIRSIGGTIAYLSHEEEGIPYVLTKEVRASTHGSVIKGKFIKCLLGSTVLPVGTEGWLFVSHKHHYSDYIRIGDMDLPARGADIIRTGSYYTFVTFVEIEDGHRVLADYFAFTEHEPKIVGKI